MKIVSDDKTKTVQFSTLKTGSAFYTMVMNECVYMKVSPVVCEGLEYNAVCIDTGILTSFLDDDKVSVPHDIQVSIIF